MFFLVKGRVNFVMELHECVFKSWPQGSYFGEIEIIFKKKRLATCKAALDCELFSLHKKNYESIIEADYPEVHTELQGIAKERERRIIEALLKAHEVMTTAGVSEEILTAEKIEHLANNRRKSVMTINSNQREYAKRVIEMNELTRMQTGVN